MYEVRVLTTKRILPNVCDGPERNGRTKEMSIISRSKKDFLHIYPCMHTQVPVHNKYAEEYQIKPSCFLFRELVNQHNSTKLMH